jgi:predicted transcriptional regulator
MADNIPTMVDKENLTIRVEKELRTKLDRIADVEHRSISSTVRVLLYEAIAAREGK